MATIDGPLDSNGNLKSAGPLDPLQAGFQQIAWKRDAARSFAGRITEEGELTGAASRILLSTIFNGAAAGALVNSQFNQQATTMASTLNGGFLRLNSGAITTINTGVSINTWRTFRLEDGSALKARSHIRHTGGNLANKQVDFGLGYYDIAAGQAAGMNEFAGFRWTLAGALLGVLEYSAGGAPTTVTVNINGGVPFSDNVARNYEVVATENGVEFWVGGVFQAKIDYQADAPGLFKAASYPVIMRAFIGATAPASAPVFDFGGLTVLKLGGDPDMPFAWRQALQGRHGSRGQAGLTATPGNTAAIPASGAAPGAVAGSNTTPVLTAKGGWFRLTPTNFTAVEVNTLLAAYQNPLVPETAGAANDAQNLIISDIMIAPMIVTSALTGGGATWQYFIAIGATAASLATADAIGGAAPGSKSPVIIALPIYDTLAAAAALGTIATRSGNDGLISLNTPLVVHPGEFFAIGARLKFLGAAVTAGTIDGSIGLSDVWD